MNEKYSQTEQLSQPQRQRDQLDDLRDAISNYHTACHDFARAEQNRNEAKAVLDKIAAEAAAVVQNAMHDPTVPQSPQTANACMGSSVGMGRLR